MKKRAFAIAFLLASLVTSVQAEEKNGWYLGTKIGWSHLHPLKYNIINDSKDPESDVDVLQENLSAPIIGIFLGYEFNPYFSFEIENDTNGFFPYKIFQKKQPKHVQINSVQLATKLSFPITDDFHLYTRLGGIVFWDNLTSKKDLKNMFNKESPLFPSLSLGAEYIFNEKFITRLDYTWKNSIKNITESSIKPSLGDAVLSFGWKFGESHINDVFSSEDDEFLNKPYTVFNENINFPFNSTELKPIAYDKLAQLDQNIKKKNLNNISIVLSGYSDRLGDDEYNQKLSEDRAYSVKNYLTSKGFSRNQITIQGMGKSYSLTNQVCNDIENKPLLISCLAPDRRVEIEILSTDTQ
ncbi:OmpA family protein [Buchnera aphidicola]|uniref:OmpA family protein n=1 Tax=Buchnera aphidicola TaxID=9 RepID=UPI003464861F